MSAPRTWAFTLTAALIATGCSTSDNASSAASRSSSKAPASPTPSPTSAFCLDLSTFQVGVLSFRSGVGKAISGQPLDFKELRRQATLVLHWGEEMETSAPPDIAEQFRTVLKAIKTSSSKLKDGSKVRDVVDPLYGKEDSAAFDAVEKYDCAQK
ncbi:hypothetical protein [Spirillospora sp. CA-128828]|uniref:hypothetical protein n=1 Tax=Spirillospora sp. CA-128828 TaxID=3240033 RepID=UPI003D8E4C9B